jgi:plastocyanin
MNSRCSTRRSIADFHSICLQNRFRRWGGVASSAGCAVLQILDTDKENPMSYAFARNATHPLRAWAALMLVFGAALAMPAICAVAATPAPTVDLNISKFAFVPKEVTIAPGTTIVWINRDETPHTVTSNNKSFASKGLDTGDKFEHTFASEGDFNYTCTIHPFMTAVVHVRKQ